MKKLLKKLRRPFAILVLATLSLFVATSCNPQTACSSACADLVRTARGVLPVDGGGIGGQLADLGEGLLLSLCNLDAVKSCDEYVKNKLDGIGALKYLQKRAAKMMKVHGALGVALQKLQPLSPPSPPPSPIALPAPPPKMDGKLPPMPGK